MDPSRPPPSSRRALVARLLACAVFLSGTASAQEAGLAWADVRIAPDGERLAILVGAGTRHALAIAELDGQDQRWVSDPMTHDVISYAWSGPRRLVITAADGTGLTGLFVVDLGQESWRPLAAPAPTAIEPQVVNALPGQPREALIAWRTEPGETLFRTNLETGTSERVEVPFSGVSGWLTDDRGHLRVIVASRADDATDRLYLRPSTTDNWRELSVASLAGRDWTPLALTEDGQRLYAAAAAAAGGYALWELDASTQGLEPLAADLAEPPTVLVAPESGRPLAININGTAQRILDPTWQALAETIDAALPEAENSIHDLSADEQRVIVRSCSAALACGYYLLERAARRLEFLGAATPPEPRADGVL